MTTPPQAQKFSGPAWRFLRALALLIEILFTRTRITGLENIPQDSSTPLIFAANHASTYDVVLLMLHIPVPIHPVGPADFQLLFPANHLVKWAGVILIHRGLADKDSIKRMSEVLKAGGHLALFPEGGTWEKRLDDVKPGVTYLSQSTGARIIPVAIGGTYGVWGRLLRLARPAVTLHFEPPWEPVTITDRKARGAELHQAGLRLMAQIYDHLPPDEQARYDLHARQGFSARLEFNPPGPSGPADEDFSVLAELISKPNLFSPLHKNLKLPLGPFLRPDRYHPPQDFLAAVQALQRALEGPQKDFLPYRLGPRKSAKCLLELGHLDGASRQAISDNRAMRFCPQVRVFDQALPPND